MFCHDIAEKLPRWR